MVLSVSLGSAGCSLLLVDGPPQGYAQMDHFHCTESNALPMLDALWAGLNFLGGVAVAVEPDDYQDPGHLIAGSVFWTVLSGWSAMTGHQETRSCRAARFSEAQERRAGPGPPMVERSSQVEAVMVKPTAETLAVGEAVQLQATAYSSAGTPLDGVRVNWNSTHDTVATVSTFGRVVAHTPGTTVVTAQSGGAMGVVEIRVVAR